MTLGKIIKLTAKSRHMLECTKEILKRICGTCGTGMMLARENKVYCYNRISGYSPEAHTDYNHIKQKSIAVKSQW